MAVRKNLVLGGSGTIGMALCSYLINIGEEVINLDLKEGFDLRETKLTAYHNVDFVWFLAWDVGGSKYLSNTKNQLNIIRNNTMICHNVFSFLEETNIPFMFASSQLAALDNTYGLTKILGEKWSSLLGGKIVKFWNVYGWEEPGEKSHVIPDLVTAALKNGEIDLLTDGEEERQFIYMDDCVKNLVEIRDGDLDEVDLTNGEWVKIKEVASMIAKEVGVPLKVGVERGYNNKVNPRESYKRFSYPTTLEKGIKVIRKKATQYLNPEHK